MRRTSIILKFLVYMLISLAISLSIMCALGLYSIYVNPLPILGFTDLRNLRYELEHFFTYTPWLIWMALVLVFFLAAFLLMALPTMRRIRRVSRAVHRISAGDYDVQLKPQGRDELAQLESDVGRMAKRIQDAFAAEREAERSKDEFMVNIAHDLRTPLTSVLGYLSLMEETQLSEEDRVHYTHVALSKARQLSLQVNGLFDLLRLTPEHIAIDIQRFRARQFLMQVQDEAYPLLEAAGMELRLADDIPDDLHLCADGLLLARVYDNMILNAIRYAQEGKYIDLDAQEKDEKVFLSVTTHANPIPEAELKAVFDRLHRVEASRSSETGGVGLGLAICKNIAALHGGEIVAQRTSDGTRFTITLPQPIPDN